MKINVAVVNSQTLSRKGIIALLASVEYINILYEANSAEDLFDCCHPGSIRPDLLILDISFSVSKGIRELNIYKKWDLRMKIVVLSVYKRSDFIQAVVQSGAYACLPGNALPEELISVIQKLYESNFWFSARIFNLKSVLAGRKKYINDISLKLTRREREVLILICKQYNSNEIAEKLFLSHRTVEGYRNNLLHKTSSRNTAGLIIYALKNQLIDCSCVYDV